MLENILALLSLLAMVLLLRPFVEIFPSLIAGVIRWKEIVNLENVIKYAISRNRIAFALIIPFCITAETFSLYTPDFMSGFNENFRLLTIIGIFTVFILVRRIIAHLAKPKKLEDKILVTANRSSWNFFIILALLLMAIGATARFVGADAMLIKNILLWTSVVVYAISLFRKMQILSSSCHFISVILYLCALEILPTGALVASAIIF